MLPCDAVCAVLPAVLTGMVRPEIAVEARGMSAVPRRPRGPEVAALAPWGLKREVENCLSALPRGVCRAQRTRLRSWTGAL